MFLHSASKISIGELWSRARKALQSDRDGSIRSVFPFFTEPVIPFHMHPWAKV
ncbi:hypothetical protein SAMN04487785_10395 [Dyella jiangningensis]|nr:hypothetical protein BDW41_101488 [Dyella sp. AtDHG13]SDJ65410.1 hypothetical protein SAMN04487785_10395 [Dyella jiangningensis]